MNYYDVPTKISAAAKIARDRYLTSPIVIDTEYVRLYTEAHKATTAEGILHPLEQRAECHARALEGLTPTIFPDEVLVGRKTRFVRGAVPYVHYACGYVVRELNQQQQEEQDSVHAIGSGGGVAIGQSLAAAADSEFMTFGKKFLLRRDELETLRSCAEYWQGKCMQDVGDRLWKPLYPQASYIEQGWRAVLFTAPHDPSPDGRVVLDFETALHEGLSHMADRCDRLAHEAHVTVTESAEQVYFWRACARVLRATVTWAHHYGEAAKALAEKPDTDAATRARMLAISERCMHAGEPPRNFMEALQTWVFQYIAGHVESSSMGYSPGRTDRYLYEYFKQDTHCWGTKEGLAETMEALECLRVKLTEMEYVSSFAWTGLGSGSLFQNMILGGLTPEGRPGDNELSYLIVQAAINCRTTQPTLSVWYDAALSDRFLMKAAECVKTGVGFPAWFNFKCFLQHELEATHLPVATIRKYAAMGGCTEPCLEGMSYGIVQPGFVNLCKVFELALYGGRDPRTQMQFEPKTPLPTNTEELIAAYNTHLAAAVSAWQGYWNYAMAAHRGVCSCIYESALTRDCIARGRCLDDGGAVVNCTPTTLSTGLVNVANSLAAVRMLVDEQHVCTMEELRDACLHDWAGHEHLQALCRAAPKWGNDDDRADQFYVRLYGDYCEIVRRGTNYLGQKYDPSMLAISTHAPFGRACLATPDGRTAGQTLADGVTSPYPGTDVSGPFSVLLSASKVDHTRIRGGLHNMKLHPATVAGARGSRKLLALIASYFKSTSAAQIQFNIVDSALLRDAQAHPENYRDLIVRVAGFSAYFVELSKPIQDEVIARTEHELPGGSNKPCCDCDKPEVEHEPVNNSSSNDDDDDDDARGALSAVEGCVFDVQDFTLHDGPGVRTTVFLKGCPLRCRWCCNPESQRFEIEDMAATATLPARTVGRRVTAGELAQQLRAKGAFMTEQHGTAAGGVTLSGGEPLGQPAFAHALATLLDHAGIPVAIETSGQWVWDRVRDIFPHLSLVYFDLKAGTPETYKMATGQDGIAIAANLKRVVSEIGAQHVVVSVPVIHGINDTEEEVRGIIRTATSAGVRRARLLPFHAMGEGKYERLGRKMELDDPVVPQKRLDEMVAEFKAAGLECTIVGVTSK